MQTLYDFGIEVQKIREAIDSIEVKGAKNASLLTYAYSKCNDIINSINEVIEKEQNTPPETDDELFEDRYGETDETIIMEEEGEMNGEPNSGTTA